MSTLQQALGADLTGYAEMQPQSPSGPAPATTENATAMMRCPLPPIFASNPDSLRQFYVGGQVPQTRILAPQTQNTFGGTLVENVSTTVISGGSSGGGRSSGGGSSGTPTLAAAQSSITTGILNPGDAYYGTLPVSRSFQLLTVTSNMAVRVQLYGTKLAQNLDANRALDVGPAPGTTQNLICDVVLDTPPYQWSFQSVVGANGDAPQAAQTYLTVTNLGQSSAPATLSFLYLPLET